MTEREMETLPLLSPGGDAGGRAKRKGLSMFFGVFVPVTLSVFSVILFLRLGFVVGQAGFYGSIGMFIGAYLVVGLTILSISAISTNGIVHGGGAYYMISRSLGPEFGGSIGIVFYLANVCASALYVAGFVEALIDNFGPDSASHALPADHWAVFGFSSAILFLCLIICIIGANAFAKASFFIFLIVMASILTVFVSFGVVDKKAVSPPSNNNELSPNASLWYTGFSKATFHENLNANFTVDYTTGSEQTFQTVFGVLFNGCTGIMAGANMSGDLADPSRSIPWGTLAGSGFTLLIYLLIVGFTSATTSREMLVNDYSYLSDISLQRTCITVGVFAATFSAALSTLIGSSRVLQAISRDNLLGNYFKFFSKETGEPIRAVLMSWFLVQLTLFVGAINVIAPIVSMLFLLCYGMLNVACFTLRVQSSPNFRPTFRYFSWHTALLGAVCCFGIMFYVSPIYAAASFFFMLLLFLFISLRDVPVEWGDVSQAIIYHQVRKYLLRLKPRSPAVKYWRPQLLLLVSNPRKAYQMAKTMNDMKKGGLLVLGTVHVAEWSQDSLQRMETEREAWHKLATLERWKAFVDGIVSPTLRSGAQALLSTAGLGGMKPNTLVIGYYRDEVCVDQLMVSVAYRAHKAADRSWKRNVSQTDFDDFDGVATCFPGLEDSPKSVASAEEYVGIIRDARAMNKNTIMAKALYELPDKLEAAKSSNAVHYIDVWVRLTAQVPQDESRTIGLLLQLATIIHMLQRWKGLKLRVLVIVDTPRDKEDAKSRILALLEDVRIVGSIVLPVAFTEVLSAGRAGIVTERSGSVQADASSITIDAPGTEAAAGQGLAMLPRSQSDLARDTNHLIRTLQTHTCLTFLALPPLPSSEESCEAYLDLLNTLTQHTGPTCLIHGCESVLTTNENSV